MCWLIWPHLLLSSGRYLASLRGHVSAVYQVAWSADSRLLVSGSSDSTLKVWDVKTGKLHTDLPGHADEVRGWRRAHLAACLGSPIKVLYLWHWQCAWSKLAISVISRVYAPLVSYAVIFFRTSLLYVIGEFRHISYFSEGLCSLYVFGNSVKCCQVFAVDWSPDGQRVASGGKDKCLRMWVHTRTFTHTNMDRIELKSNILRYIFYLPRDVNVCCIYKNYFQTYTQ